jgi:ATP-dependent Clp protease adapter protein ClpS
MLLSITDASSPKKLQHNSREVRQSKLRHDEAGGQRREKVLFKLLNTNDDVVPMTFVNLVFNR